MPVLQITTVDLPAWAQLLSQGLNGLIALTGLFIAYQAYRGYRRNDSRPMFFIAVGFILVVGLPFVLVVPTALFGDDPTALVVLTVFRDVATLAGTLAILYALRMPSE
jgi:hypothetical protein